MGKRVLLHLYKILEQAKLFYSFRKQVNGCLGPTIGVYSKGHEGSLWEDVCSALCC